MSTTATDARLDAEITEEGTRRELKTSRWTLRYHDVGEGAPIVLLHGTGPGATGWSNFGQNIGPLSARHRVIALDFPGWGGSDVFDCEGENRNHANAEAVRLLLDGLGLDKAALVGNSMGGAAALAFLAAHPERVTHAVTMGSGLFGLPNIFSPAGLSEGLRVIVDTYRDPSPANFRRLVKVMVYDSAFVTDALVEARSAAALANQAHLTNWLKWGMRDPGGFAGVAELLSGLVRTPVPTLMIHGRDDRVVPMETTLRTAALIPNVRAVILNRCGHWAQVEHATEFNRLLSGFLETPHAG